MKERRDESTLFFFLIFVGYFFVVVVTASHLSRVALRINNSSDSDSTIPETERDTRGSHCHKMRKREKERETPRWDKKKRQKKKLCHRRNENNTRGARDALATARCPAGLCHVLSAVPLSSSLLLSHAET